MSYEYGFANLGEPVALARKTSDSDLPDFPAIQMFIEFNEKYTVLSFVILKRYGEDDFNLINEMRITLYEMIRPKLVAPVFVHLDQTSTDPVLLCDIGKNGRSNYVANTPLSLWKEMMERKKEGP